MMESEVYNVSGNLVIGSWTTSRTRCSRSRSRARGSARAGRGTTTALVLASNAPDIDIVTTAGGALNYLHWHRGPTHGPLGIIGLGLATAGLVVAGRRLFDKRKAEPGATYSQLALVSIVGVLLHVLMDLPTSYGTRPLSPFGWHWYAEDWMPIVDIYLLTALAAGLLFGRGSDEIRRHNVSIVLSVMLVIYGVRAVAHHEALALAPRLFGPTLPAPCAGAPSRSAPDFFIERWPQECGLPAGRAPVPGGHRRHAQPPLSVSLARDRADVELVRDVRRQPARQPLSPAAERGRSAVAPRVALPESVDTCRVRRGPGARGATLPRVLAISARPLVRRSRRPWRTVTVQWSDMRFAALSTLGAWGPGGADRQAGAPGSLHSADSLQRRPRARQRRRVRGRLFCRDRPGEPRWARA